MAKIPLTQQLSLQTRKIGSKALNTIREALKNADEIYLFENDIREHYSRAGMLDDEQAAQAFHEEAENSETSDWGGKQYVPYCIQVADVYHSLPVGIKVFLYCHENASFEETNLDNLSEYMWCMIADSLPKK